MILQLYTIYLLVLLILSCGLLYHFRSKIPRYLDIHYEGNPWYIRGAIYLIIIMWIVFLPFSCVTAIILWFCPGVF